MTRSSLAGGLSGLLFWASLAVAQDQAPPLTPPALDPPAPAPNPAMPGPQSTSGPGSGARPATSPTVKAAPAESRPLLVIPGVTAPLPTRPGTRRAAPGLSRQRGPPTQQHPLPNRLLALPCYHPSSHQSRAAIRLSRAELRSRSRWSRFPTSHLPNSDRNDCERIVPRLLVRPAQVHCDP